MTARAAPESTDFLAERSATALPLMVLGGAVLACIVLLLVPLRLPLGPNYWDLPIYLDGAHRIALGQMPAVDFDMPVGPIGYLLTLAGIRLFPDGHPLFIVQWSVMVFTLPPMTWLMMVVRQRTVALLLLLPFLVYQLLPFNLQAYTTYPGVDGYGFYNRHVCILLYTLVAVLMFATGAAFRAVALFIVVTVLFFLKITGFVAAGLIGLLAVVSGRVLLSHALAAGIAFIAVLAGVEMFAGFVSAYVADILALASLNSGTLLPRFLTVASVRFDVIFACTCLIAVLMILSRRSLLQAISHLVSKPTLRDAMAFLDRPIIWLCVVLFAGIAFETQNTGSQELIFLWPVLLRVLMEWRDAPMAWPRSLVFVLVAATVLPSLTVVLHRAARAVLVAPRYVALDLPLLGTLGHLSTKPDIAERVVKMGDHYAAHRSAYEDLTERGQLPAWTYYSEIAMQGTWILELNRAAEALLAFEREKEVRFNSIYVMDFTSPLAWALGRDAPKHVQIGLDASRTLGELASDTKAALEGTDAVLQPLCPVTGGRQEIAAIFAPALTGHERVSLDRCWDMWVKR